MSVWFDLDLKATCSKVQRPATGRHVCMPVYASRVQRPEWCLLLSSLYVHVSKVSCDNELLYLSAFDRVNKDACACSVRAAPARCRLTPGRAHSNTVHAHRELRT